MNIRMLAEVENVVQCLGPRESKLLEENSLLKEEIESKVQGFGVMMEVLQLISEDDVAFLTDVVGYGKSGKRG